MAARMGSSAAELDLFCANSPPPQTIMTKKKVTNRREAISCLPCCSSNQSSRGSNQAAEEWADDRGLAPYVELQSRRRASPAPRLRLECSRIRRRKFR